MRPSTVNGSFVEPLEIVPVGIVVVAVGYVKVVCIEVVYINVDVVVVSSEVPLPKAIQVIKIFFIVLLRKLMN